MTASRPVLVRWRWRQAEGRRVSVRPRSAGARRWRQAAGRRVSDRPSVGRRPALATSGRPPCFRSTLGPQVPGGGLSLADSKGLCDLPRSAGVRRRCRLLTTGPTFASVRAGQGAAAFREVGAALVAGLAQGDGCPDLRHCWSGHRGRSGSCLGWSGLLSDGNPGRVSRTDSQPSPVVHRPAGWRRKVLVQQARFVASLLSQAGDRCQPATNCHQTMRETRLTRLLGIRHPIVQAGMARPFSCSRA